MVTIQRALQRDCAQQREEANARANAQNQALIRLMEAFRDISAARTATSRRYSHAASSIRLPFSQETRPIAQGNG